MKRRSISLLISILMVIALKSSGYPVYMAPDNIVKNPIFDAYWKGGALGENWTGILGLVGTLTNAPNEYAAFAADAYQDLPTIAGQKYAISFFAAADLYFGPSASVTVALNQQPLLSFSTTPHGYDPNVNRFSLLQFQEIESSFIANASSTRLEFIVLNSPHFLLASVSVVPIPEPSSIALILLGAGAAVIRRKLVPNKSLANGGCNVTRRA